MSATARGALVIAAAAILMIACLAYVVSLMSPLFGYLGENDRIARSFRVASDSMRPTLIAGDTVMPRRLAAKDVKRGDVFIVATGQGSYISRIVAVGGDKVAMQDGRLVLNGHPVAVKADGQADAGPQIGMAAAFLERLPGERSPHRILDGGISPGDQFGPVIVPVGSFFALGDNRDNAADSRYGPAEGGMGMISADRLFGQVDFIAWSYGRRRFARPISDLSR